MLTILNRREVRITHSTREQIQITTLLQENGIDYQIRTLNMLNAGRYHGMIGVDPDAAYEYHIYVHKNDWEQAKCILDR